MTEKEGVSTDWVATTLTVSPSNSHALINDNIIQRQMRRIMLACHQSICHRLEQRLGFFELLGFDFMLDSENHVSEAIEDSTVCAI